MDQHTRADFEQAIGEAFGAALSPPIPWEEASAHECCEVVWQVMGTDVAPVAFATCTDAQCAQLAEAFGRYFETDSPSVEQIKTAIARLLARWPVDT